MPGWWTRFGLSDEEKHLVRSMYEVENMIPDLYRLATSDPEDMGRRVKRWLGVYITSMRGEATERRRWNVWMAVREFIQNAMDAADEYGGVFRFRVDGRLAWVYNSFGNARPEDAKVKLYAWEYGRSTKKCWQRGWFGEGMKMASLALLSMGRHVYLFSYDVVYKPILWRNRLVIVLGEPVDGEREARTIVYIFPVRTGDLYPVSPDTATFQQLLEKHRDKLIDVVEYDVPSCPKKAPNYILDLPDMLYVRDIFVNTMSNITRKSRFTYNLWWVELDPNRNTPRSTIELEREIARVLVSSDKALKKLVEAFCKYKGDYIDCTCRDFYECTIDFGVVLVPDETKRNFIEYIGEVFKVNPSDLVIMFGNYKIDLIIHLDMVPVVIDYGWEALVPTDSLADVKIAEKLEMINRTAVAVDEESLPLEKRAYVEFARALAKHLFLKTRIVVATGSTSHYDSQTDTIYLMLEDLEHMPFGTIVHELAHAYGTKMYGSAPDISENFERALTYVTDMAMKFVLEKSESIKRAFNGGFAAVHSLMETGPQDSLVGTLTPIVKKIARKYNVELKSVRGYVFELARNVVQFLDIPPAYINLAFYRRGDTLDYFFEEPYTSSAYILDYKELTYKEYMEKVKKNALKELDRLRSKFEGKPLVSLVYDPAKDEYILLRAENIE